MASDPETGELETVPVSTSIVVDTVIPRVLCRPDMGIHHGQGFYMDSISFLCSFCIHPYCVVYLLLEKTSLAEVPLQSGSVGTEGTER